MSKQILNENSNYLAAYKHFKMQKMYRTYKKCWNKKSFFKKCRF